MAGISLIEAEIVIDCTICAYRLEICNVILILTLDRDILLQVTFKLNP